MLIREESLPNGVYPELVRSLFRTLMPSSIMSVGYVVCFGVLASAAQDTGLVVFACLGVLSGAARLLVVLLGRGQAAQATLTVERARALELRFAVAYFQFALLLGVSAVYVFLLEPAEYHMLTMCLLVGYGAGVASGIGLRPWIALPSMICATVPAALVALLHPEAVYWATSVMGVALLAGGAQSVMTRYRVATIEIAQRVAFEALARRDDLTGLPNRLAMREWYVDHVIKNAVDRQPFAVHCLDLDDFKPVNDVFGHVIGDTVLKAIAARLTRAVPRGDMVVRLGGDEFAVIQRNVHDPQEAADLASRLRTVISEPFSIQDRSVGVSACIGYTLSPVGSNDLEALIYRADRALYDAKSAGKGMIRGCSGRAERI